MHSPTTMNTNYMKELSPKEREIFHRLHHKAYQRFMALPNKAGNEVTLDILAQKAVENGILIVGENHSMPKHQSLEQELIKRIVKTGQGIIFCLEPGMEQLQYAGNNSGQPKPEVHLLWNEGKALDLGAEIYLSSHNRDSAKTISELSLSDVAAGKTIISICGNNHVRSATHSIQYFMLLRGLMPLVVTQDDALGTVKFSNYHYNLGRDFQI